MSSLNEEQKALVREQSAALNAALFGAPPAPGVSRVQGGTPGRLTPGQRWMLDALKKMPGGNATPAELIAAHPERWAGVPVRGATFSLHRTGSHLAGMGLVKRGRRSVDRHGTGRTSGGPRLYRLTAEGRRA